ncbi:MAG: hypothetical protein KQI35_17510 [Bacteroidetes bacterium]|nr:hypothetical protein [Bacteroidota bacterium]
MPPLKKEIVEACRKIAEEKAGQLKEAMEEAQQAANEYGAPKDRYDSFRTQLLRKRDMYGQQLSKINEQIEALDKINPDNKVETVSYGAVVITEFQKLFISTGIGKFEYQGETYYAISGVVPVFKAMEGKKKGERYVFNGREIKILDVF